MYIVKLSKYIIASKVNRYWQKSGRGSYTYNFYHLTLNISLHNYLTKYKYVIFVIFLSLCSGVDVENFLKYFKIDSSRYSTASTFAVSYIIYKILLPIRATITVTCVPLIVRSLRARGWMKTPSQTQPPSSTPPPNN